MTAVEAFGLQEDGQTTCPPPEVVQASRAGTLPPRLQEGIDMHVAHCGVCRALLTVLEDESVGEVTPNELERVRQRVQAGVALDRRNAARRRVWRWSAAAAIVAAASVGAVLWLQNTGTVFQVDEAELLSLVQTGQRDFRPVTPGEQSDLANALAPSQKDDIRETAERLTDLASRRPRSAATHLYLGVTNLVLDRDALAVSSLETAERLARTDASSLLRGANWYLALAYRRTGQFDSARSRLELLCANRGDYAGRACQGLQEMSAVFRLSGTVTGPNGEPLAGVTVGEHLPRVGHEYLVTSPTRFSSTTDASGKFTVFGLPVATARRTLIRAAKPGYFTASAGPWIAPQMQADFRLIPWTHIRLGEIVKGTVKAEDTMCDPDRCHQFALTVAAQGTLEVSVAAPVPERMDLYVESPSGEMFGPQFRAPMFLALPATAGSTFQIRVMSFIAEPRSYELTTRLR